MKRIINAAAVALLAVSSAFGSTPAKADFTGAWTLDLAKSEGLPPVVKAQKVTIKQTGDTIEIETKTTLEEGDQTQSDKFVVDGKETDYTPKAPNGIEGKGKRTATWGADGNTIDIREAAVFETPMGSADVKITRKWTLSADGKTFTIEMNVESPMGTQNIKRTFAKG